MEISSHKFSNKKLNNFMKIKKKTLLRKTKTELHHFYVKYISPIKYLTFLTLTASREYPKSPLILISTKTRGK